MIVRPLALPGTFEVVFPPASDERGNFQRLWCATTLADAGINFTPVQASRSRNPRRATLRGLHFQQGEATEQKLVGCSAGAVFDVAVDVRPGSPSFGQHVALRLDAAVGNALFVPRGFAHGFLTLTADAAVDYLIDAAHQPAAASGYRWDDPAFAIEWPMAPALVSDRDRSWPDCG